MGVYIKGVEMPKNCSQCNFRKFNKYDGCAFDCIVTGKGLAENEMSDKKRPYHCPLVELPSKHGRLVDCDALMEKESTQYENVMKDGQRDWFDKIIADLIHKTLEVTLTEMNAPTVLEPEE